MRVVVATWFLLAACSGGGETPTDTTADTQDTTPDKPEGPCDDLPKYDIESLDCRGLRNAFLDTVGKTDECETAADCKAIRARCEDWSGVACHYSVNQCLDAGLIGEYNGRAVALACNKDLLGGSCVCPAAPEVDCVNRRCTFSYDTY